MNPYIEFVKSLGCQQITIQIAPMGKPRMTKRDKWQKRDCVMRYRAYADFIRLYAKIPGWFTGEVSWIAYLPIPKSWSKKKILAMAGQAHEQTPDRDNIDKGILDALLKNDSCIHAGVMLKLRDDGNGPRIELFLR